jgi:hypothetical protein
LTLGRSALGVVVLLMACGCGASGGTSPVGTGATVDARDLVLTTAEDEVCVASGFVLAPCVPVVASDEPVVAATVTALEAAADLVMLLARPDVVVAGLGPGTARIPVRPGGRELVLWLRTVPAGTPAVCASYRAADDVGRLVVHRGRTVRANEVVAVDAEPDDGC